MIGYPRDKQFMNAAAVSERKVSRSGLLFTDIQITIPLFRKDKIRKRIERTEVKQRCNLRIIPAGNPTTYPGN